MGWADDAQELDDSMLPSYARDGDTGKRGGERRRRRVFETRGETESFAALLGGGAQTFEKKNPGDGNENSNANEKNSNGGGGGGGGERGLGEGRKDQRREERYLVWKEQIWREERKRADPSWIQTV